MATVGAHPTEKEDFDYSFYRNLAENKKVVAIGECGLDYHRKENKKEQKIIFLEHIRLSKEINKPLMIHCRGAFGDLIEILIAGRQLLITDNPGVLHFFTGTIEDAGKLSDLGFYFNFGGLITFNRSFDEVVKFIPLERIMLETDAPYVAPLSMRYKRNEPYYISEIAQKLAEIKNVSLEEVCEKTTNNAVKLFNLTR